MQFRLVPHDDFLLFDVVGVVSPDAWRKVLAELENAMEPLPGDRLVLNLMGLLGWLGVPERRQVGALMGTHFARMKKVALVIQEEKITDVVKSQAQRQGLDLSLFSSYEEAASWVRS